MLELWDTTSMSIRDCSFSMASYRDWKWTGRSFLLRKTYYLLHIGWAYCFLNCDYHVAVPKTTERD
jgi:hypothetical protein